MFNLHTHTTRCHHAQGEDREYVEAAIRAGYTTLGFSDHAPMLFPEGSGYISTFRMLPSDFEGYVQSVLDLRREYASDICIYLGAEAEYYPELFERNLRFYREYPIDYLIMGQHFIGNEYDGSAYYSGRATDDTALLRRYVKQVTEGMQTGAFTYFAHPDLINYTGDKAVYRYEVARLCEAAKKCSVPLEVNALGFLENRCYPNKLFWEVAREVGCDVVIGVDAHNPLMLADTDLRTRLEKWVKKMKLHLLTDVPPLRDPHGLT